MIDKMYLMFPSFKGLRKERQKLRDYAFKNLRGKTLSNTIDNITKVINQLDPEDKLVNFDEERFAKILLATDNKELLSFELDNFVEAVLKSKAELAKFIKEEIPNYNNVEKLKYFNYDNSKPESEQTKEALQNRLIELYKSVLLNENVISEVMTPVDFDYFKNDIKSLIVKKPVKNLSTFNQLDDIGDKYKFLAGKAGTGQQSNNLMDYILGSLANANGNNFRITNFEVPKSNEKLDMEYSQELSSTDLKYYKETLGLGDEGNKLKFIKISNSLSAILNGFVDLAKDPFTTDGNWNTMTTNTGNLLLRKGVHLFYVNAFLAQPIIKEYVEFDEQYRNSKNQILSSQEAFIEQRFGKYNYDNSYKTNIFNKTLKDLRSGIAENDESFQMNVFSTFLQYQSASKAIKTNIDASKFMVNGIGGSVNSLIMAKNAVDSILDAEDKYNALSEEDKKNFKGNIILGFRSKFTNPNGSESMFSKYYKNIIIKPEQIVRANPKLFLVANNTIQDTFNEISHAVYGKILVNDDLGTQLEKDHYSYTMSGFQPLKITVEEKRDLLINFSKEFEQFKDDNKGVYTIIDQMIVKPGENRDFVVLNNRKKSTEFENNMVDSFSDLLNDEPEFTDKLIKYSYLTSGFAMNMNQFFTMIPSQWFSRNKINRYIIDTARNYDSFNEFNEDEFTDQFFLANLENSKFVKNITDSQIEKNSLKTNNGFVMKKAGKQGYFRVKQNEQGNIYYKLIGYNNQYKGVYTRFISNIKGEYVDVQPLNKKDKKGNRIINFNTDGIMLKPTTTAIGNLYDKTKMEALYKEAILPRDVYYREDVIEEVNNEILVQETNTPVFNTLPNKSDIPTMTYAGIGSRETPDNIQSEMTELAKMLEERGYTLRSGGAKGADSAFEAGVKTKKEIFLGSKKTGEKELQIAREIHPNSYALDNSKNPDFVWNLMARNTNQIFGEDLKTPVDFVIAWTQDGLDETKKRSLKSGGTGQAIDMASRKGIPVINLANSNWKIKLNNVLEGKIEVKPQQLSLFDNSQELWNVNKEAILNKFKDFTFEQFSQMSEEEQNNLINCL